MDWTLYREHALVLTNRGYIPVDGPLCPEMEEIFKECVLNALTRKRSKPLTVLIDSDGGPDQHLISMKAAMLTSRLEFNGLVMGRAKSNAFRLLQACNKRSAVAGAELQFHWGQYTLSNSDIAQIMQGVLDPIDHIKQQRELVVEELHLRTGISVTRLHSFANYERSFTAHEALALQMIDSLATKLPREISRKVKGSPKADT